MSSKSYSKSKSTVVTEDNALQIAGDSQIALGKSAQYTSAGSGSVVIDAPNTRLGNITLNQFPEQVQSTMGGLIESVNATTKTLGQSLSTQQLGATGEMTKMAMIVVVGGGLIFLASKVIKR